MLVNFLIPLSYHRAGLWRVKLASRIVSYRIIQMYYDRDTTLPVATNIPGVMAAYRRVYDSLHLQADCQEPGSAPEPYAL